MTEAEWLACTDPDPLVRLLWETGSKRKLRLFAVACCQRLLHLVSDARFRAAVTAAEDFADGLISMDRIEVIGAECLAASMPEGSCLNPEVDAAWIMKHLPNCCRHDDPADHILDFFSFIHLAVAGSQARVNSEPWQIAYKAEQEAECSLLRDIFGPIPFRSITLDPSWLTWHDGLLVSMARRMYESRDFSDMPVLADALEEAGCTNQDILGHRRSGGEHVRGCWVVDALLGKE